MTILGNLGQAHRTRAAGSAPIGFAVVLIIAGVFPVAAQSSAQWPAPAFGERSLYLLHAPILGFSPADPSSPAPGGFEVSLREEYSSTFARTWHATTIHHNDFGRDGKPWTAEEAAAAHLAFPHDAVIFVDGELSRTMIVTRYGVTPEFSVSIEVGWVSHSLISADSVVDGFHGAVGLSRVGRDKFPYGRFVVMLQAPDSAMFFTDREPKAGVSDTTATLSWRNRPGDSPWRLGGDLSVEAPTGSSEDFNGSGSWDSGVLGFVRYEGEMWQAGGEAGIVRPGRWKAPGNLGVSTYERALVWTTRRIFDRYRAGVSLTVEGSPFRRDRLDFVSEPGAEVAVGIERDFGRNWSARLTLTENLPGFGDRADVGLTLRIRTLR